MKQPTKAIICAAGLGTRFLPQTKAMPKEMLPIIDKPVIQLIVEKAVEAGVTDVILVTGSTKRAVEDHFDRSVELEAKLRSTGKNKMADEIQKIAELANFIYIRQKGAEYGNARPIIEAQHLINDEPFFVFFPDDYFRSDYAWPKQLKDAYNKTGKSVISLAKIDKKDSDKYGMAEIGEQLDDKIFSLTGFVEKPGEKNTPSCYASAGSYLFTPDILPFIECSKPGKNGEYWLPDCIIELIKLNKVCGCEIDGVWRDTGDHLQYMMTIVDEALASPKYGDTFKQYLEDRLCK